MKKAAPADLRRWSEEVARDPASLAFVPLADAYRRLGHRDAALRLCLRGLEHHPSHTGAHLLLARLYLEGGDRERASDEWSTVLRLEPESFEANRGLGFVHLERRETEAARRHLECAAAARPEDAAVRGALRLIEERTAAAAAPVPAAPESIGPAGRDPGAVFRPLFSERPLRAALLLDRQGLVLASTVTPGFGSSAESVGAALGAAVEEAARAARYLDLGEWGGMLLETTDARVHVSPLEDGLTVLVAADAGAPTGWIRRTAARALELARGFTEVDA